MVSLWSSLQTSRASVQVELGGEFSWWRHQMETFSALLAICVGNSPVPGDFPTQRPVKRSFDVLFDLRPNKRLSKQSWGCWFEAPSGPIWRHCNVMPLLHLPAKRMVLLSDIIRNTVTFSSFINTMTLRVAKMSCRGKQYFVYLEKYVTWLVMISRPIKPGHQQLRY